ncbi:amidohydrolase family protein [Alcaligenes faecalis]|uniref:amidohydrolase family protein n=1 Tax=Alcaligenes faecalis TaxID=511 RepID=UPI001C829749|nr:amidohydrolase family protein [Alcaligenes faecalis]
MSKTGQPHGVLVYAGLDKVTVILPKPTEKQLLAAAKAAVETNNHYGITAWMDPAANVGPGEALFSRPLGGDGEGILPAYRVLSEAGLFTAHVAALLVASPDSDAADLDRLDSVRKRFAHIPNLSLPGIKVFADGVLEYPAQSAALLGRYENSGKQGELLLEQHGAVVVGASDWPISTVNPWEAIHHAMTRSGPGGGLNAGERMDKDSMFTAYTINAARAIRMEGKIGSLEAGKQAEFIVLDRDVLEVDVETLKDTRVLATYFAGQQVYGATL